MTAEKRKHRLREALHAAGSDWILEFWGREADKNLRVVLKGLEQFQKAYSERFGESPDPFALIESNPSKGAAFFQIDTLRLSTEMKIMVWRILSGCEIARVECQYDAGNRFSLKVVLQPKFGEGQETYTSDVPWDFRVLRHFGSAGIDGELFLQGYYALRLAD